MEKASDQHGSVFYFVQKLSSQERLLHEQKITMDDLKQTVNEIKRYLTSFVKFTRSSYEEECGIVLYIILQRIRAFIEMENNILDILSTQTHFFDTCIDAIMERIQLLLHSEMERDGDHRFGFNEQEFKTSKTIKQKRTNYPKNVSKILRDWLSANMLNPYPSEAEKLALSKKTGLDQTQINNWFINARRRILPVLKQKANKH